MFERTTYTIKEPAVIPDLNRIGEPILFLNGNGTKRLLAVGIESECLLALDANDPLDQLQNYIDSKPDWIFGYLSYDLKNNIEDLESHNPDGVNMPLLHFFQPRFVVEYAVDACTIHGLAEPSDSLVEALKTEAREQEHPPIHLLPKIDKDTYLERVNHLLEHIQQGDIYEINFCHEFFSTEEIADPFSTYLSLNRHTHAPYSVYGHLDNKHILCASPERYIKKTGSKVISQPIKGTIKRGKTEAEDEQLKKQLANDPKEQSENVMIVDLVRNDLSRSAKRASVKVDELFGIYTFETVHQMISTVSAEMKDDVSLTRLIKDTYPMGSMTGAPKVRAMKLAEHYECNRRGLYSGTIGYITPEGDFDFNVVIRTILYDASKPYISATVGGAITAQCDPEKEYEESLLKAEALKKSLSYD